MSGVGTKHLLANFSAGHARLIDPSFLRMTGEFGYVMGRNEASPVSELFYQSCTADRSFVPQDDREIGYVMGRYKASIRELLYLS